MRLSAIQDLYPNPPVLRYHRLAPKIEREFGEIAADKELTAEVEKKINWLDIVAAFLLGYLIGGHRHE